MKKISLLGSTGSIGTQTLDIIKNNPDKFNIVGLTVHSNIDLLQKQIEVFNPEAVAVFDEARAEELKKKASVVVYSGLEGIKKIASMDEADTMVNSLVGSIGVEPTYEAINAKKNIALANKETLVTAGSVIMDAVKKNDVALMPIDSEHSAIFQCLNGEDKKTVRKITLTASGGPFRAFSQEQLRSVSKKDALAHPTWSMGNKITIDSATLMNKGFEVIETRWLYDIGYDKIDVVVHPQSIIHSMVEFRDTSVMAQLGMPNMRLPIQYALGYPERFAMDLEQLDLARSGKLTFEKPDLERFPCLGYAYDAGKLGGSMPAVLNAANEVAVAAFLDEKIAFIDIPKMIRQAMDQHTLIKSPDLKTLLKIDKTIKEKTRQIIAADQ